MIDFHNMTRLEALNYFLERARKIEKDLEQLSYDVEYAESRFPGSFTDQLLGIRSDLSAARNKVASLTIQRDQEAAK